MYFYKFYKQVNVKPGVSVLPHSANVLKQMLLILPGEDHDSDGFGEGTDDFGDFYEDSGD